MVFLSIFITISVIINIIFTLPYVKYYYDKWYRYYFDKPFFTNEKNSLIIKAVADASIKINKTLMSQQEFCGLFEDIKSYFRPKRNSKIKNNFYTSYLYAGLSQYALSYNDNNITQKLIKIAENFIDRNTNRLNYDIFQADQYPIGILYINLYKITKDICYRDIATSIYQSLINENKTPFVIKYNKEPDKNYVDSLGMTIPFLMEYHNLTNDAFAKELAIYNIKNYYLFGVDKETGIPAHGYNMSNKMKLGSINWGRGIGWYLFSLSYCSGEIEGIIPPHIDIPLTQFPSSSLNFDSSTALMTVMYNISHNTPNKLSLNFIKGHIRTNGLISNCSGDTYGFNNYSHSFSESELCNGLFLLLVSKYKEHIEE